MPNGKTNGSHPKPKKQRQSAANTVNVNPEKFEFTGGKNLTGFAQLAHIVMMNNELYGGKGAYKLSHAVKGRSGYSFGGNQMDLLNSKETAARNTFRDILNHYVADKKLDSKVVDEILQVVTTRGKTLEPTKQLPLVNAALKSEYGKTTIDNIYEKELAKKISHVDAVIATVADPEVRKKLQDDQVKVILLDYHNQFNIDLTISKNKKQLVSFLQQLDGSTDIKEQIRGFIKETKWGKSADGKLDVQRRQDKIDKVLEALQKHKAKEEYTEAHQDKPNSTSHSPNASPVKYPKQDASGPLSKDNTLPQSNQSPTTDQKSKVPIPDATVDPVNNNVPDTTQPSADEMRQNITSDLIELGATQEQAAAALGKMTDPEDLSSAYLSIHNTLQAYRADRKEYLHNELQGYSQGFDFISQLGRQVGSPFLIQAGTVGKHVIAGYQAIQKLSEIKWGDILAKGIGIGAATGGIALLGSAILGILGAFLGGGPDPTEIILEGINRLQDQINTLREEMHEGFYQNAKQQAEMFQHIAKSLEQLTVQLNEGVTSIKLDIRAHFAKLQAALGYLTTLKIESDKEALLIKLTELSDQVAAWKESKGAGDPAKEVPKTCNKLFSWVKSHSHHPTLNGAILWRTWVQKQMRIDAISEVIPFAHQANVDSLTFDANAFIGFLGEYANFIRTKYLKEIGQTGDTVFIPRAAELPNPIIMHKAQQNYTLLKYLQPMFDNDPGNSDIAEADDMLKSALNSIELINCDENLWRALIHDYHLALLAIDKIVENFIEYKSKKLLRERNGIYEQHERENHQAYNQARQANIDEYNILSTEINELLNKFLGRRLNHLEGDIETLANMPAAECGGDYEGIPGSQMRKNRIYSNFTAEQDQGLAAVLAAEYLGLINIRAKQSGNIEGLVWNYTFHVPAKMVPHPYNYQLDVDEVTRAQYRNVMVPTFPDNGAGVGRGAKAYHANVNIALSVRDTSWQLPIDMVFILNHDTLSAARLSFSESWRNAPSVEGICWTENNDFAQVDGVWYAKYGTPGGNCIPPFYKNASRAILGRYNDANSQVQCQKRQILSAADITRVKSKVFDHLLSMRKSIANALAEGSSNTEEQAFVNQFNTALAYLNKSVYFMRWLAVLSGKDIRKCKLDDLLTGEQIITQLRNYRDTAHTSLLTPLTNAKATVEQPDICLSDITDLPVIKVRELSPHHPKAILRQSLSRLALFKRWKKLFKNEFPDLQNSSLEEHELKCQLSREVIFQDETFALLQEIKEQAYSEARFIAQHHMRYSKRFEAQDYTRIFNAICLWGMERSLNSSSIGLTADIALDLDSVKTQQWLLGASKRRWFSNLGFLVKYAQANCGLNFEKYSPCNLIMWGDGLLSLLKLIYNDRYAIAAKEAGYNTEGYLTAVQDFMHAGVELKSIVYKMSISTELYTNLFANYLNKLDRSAKWLQEIIGRTPDQTAAYRQFVFQTKNYTNRKLDGLAAQGMLLKTYISMLLEADLSPDSEVAELMEFMDRDAFIEYLQETDENSYAKNSLLKRIQSHKNKIEKLQKIVLHRVAKAKDIYNIWLYLQTYFKDRGVTSRLALTKQHLNDLEINGSCKLDLLNQFLGIHKHIKVMEISHVNLSLDHVEFVTKVFNKHQQLDRLVLQGCNLTPDMVEQLSGKLSDLANLKTFVLNHCKLTDEQLEAIKEKIGTKINVVNVDTSDAAPKDLKKIPAYNLLLQLPIGHHALHRLLSLGMQAQQALTKRVMVERSGLHLKDIERLLTSEETASLKQLQDLTQEVKDEANRIATTNDLVSTKNSGQGKINSNPKLVVASELVQSSPSKFRNSFFHDKSKKQYKSDVSVKTLGDGNCAFNGVSIGLCELLENSQISVNNGVNQFLQQVHKRLLLADNKLETFKRWLSVHRNSDERQRLIAPILREMAVKCIQDNYNDYSDSYSEALLVSYRKSKQLSAVENDDDTFIVHPFIVEQFKACDSEQQLLTWWNSKGHNAYFDAMKVQASGGHDRARYGSEIEIDALAKQFGITIAWCKANMPLQKLGVCGGIIDGLSKEQALLLASLEVGEFYKGKMRLFQLDREELKKRMAPLSDELAEKLGQRLVQAKQNKNRIFNTAGFRLGDLEILKKRHIIYFDSSKREHVLVGDDHDVDEINIKRRMEGASDLIATVLANYQENTPYFIIQHEGQHWQYINRPTYSGSY